MDERILWVSGVGCVPGFTGGLPQLTEGWALTGTVGGESELSGVRRANRRSYATSSTQHDDRRCSLDRRNRRAGGFGAA